MRDSGVRIWTTMGDRRRQIREAYDDIGMSYATHRSASPPELTLLDDAVADLPTDARILDAGCGAGEPVTRFLVDRFDVTGLDFSRGQLALARDRVSEVSPVQGDMTALPFADGTFDALCSIYAVIHVPWEYHRRCFAEFHRVLRPGAPLLVTVGTTNWTGCTADWMGFGAAMHWDIPGPARTTKLFADVGFAVEDRTAIPDDVGDEAGEKLFIRARSLR